MRDVAMQAIQASLDGLAARQRIIAENIANVDTPGYLAGRVSFEESLAGALVRGDDPAAVEIGRSRSLEATRMNGNNVSVDEENVALIETGLRYQLAVESMNNKFRILRASLRRDG